MQADDYNSAVATIRVIIARFQKIEQRPWDAEGAVIELTKQVGELCALIMSREGYYFKGREQHDSRYMASDDAIADELFDILYATIRLADHYGVDLVAATKKEEANNRAWFESKGLSF